MKKIACLAGFTFALASLAGPAAARRLDPGPEAASNVVTRVTRGDCVRAANELNAALPGNYPEVNLLAGSMLENGVCLKQDWKRPCIFT